MDAAEIPKMFPEHLREIRPHAVYGRLRRAALPQPVERLIKQTLYGAAFPFSQLA